MKVPMVREASRWNEVPWDPSNGPSVSEIGGLYTLVAGKQGHDQVLDYRRCRQVLRSGIDQLLDRWGWRQVGRDNRRTRLFASPNGGPVAPISISYSGTVAMIAVSQDWHAIGVDLEISPLHKLQRYVRLVEAFTGCKTEDSIGVFVRAEAWAKACGLGFTFGASHFLRQSLECGGRYDGKHVEDLCLEKILPASVRQGKVFAAAICRDVTAPPLRVHPLRYLGLTGDQEEA